MLYILQASTNIMSIIETIDFDDPSHSSKYPDFLEALKISDKDLCVHKGQKSHSLLEILNDNFDNKYHSDKKIYYISDVDDDDKRVIKAFAFLKIQPRIRIMNKSYEGLSVELELRCSAQKGLGLILLEHVYDEYVERQNYLLKRVPDNEDLKTRYAKWKLPAIPECIAGDSFLHIKNIDDILGFIRSTVPTDDIEFSIAKCLGLFDNEIILTDKVDLKYELYNETIGRDDSLPEHHKRFMKDIIEIWYQKKSVSTPKSRLSKEVGVSTTKPARPSVKRKYKKTIRPKWKIHRRNTKRNTKRKSNTVSNSA